MHTDARVLFWKVEQVCQAFHRRREYVAAFLSAFGRWGIVYNSVK